MFKVLDLQTGQDINILSPRWFKQLDQLHTLDHQDRLVCPACLQPMRVRLGVFRRSHFAHKHLKNCPFVEESEILLNSRAVLYQWLVDQFGETQVTIEKKLVGFDLSHPVDCWVEVDSLSFAYWIFDTRLPPAERELLHNCFNQLAVRVNWLFVSNMLRVDEFDSNQIHLTTTERNFMQSTACDEANKGLAFTPGKTLHYLDADKSFLTTYRNLRLIHLPQLFSGNPYHDPLISIKVSALTGDFLHPGESERIVHKELHSHPGSHENDDPVLINQENLPTCLICGQITDDYWYLNRADNTCKCRECYRNGRH